eukprot:CAMPEP_0184979866 /NCGR_PEP_ID=MMETSP1098-20130426/9961_1 /TAXON_ID=89044 /ORGANISM="Spumella elongata, Strain CCAP 955/1" /LENGTH=550 /DNA_ID=CAMNT_0027503201 /DNA_START=246 /DNA_END=1898 /DNA_ORIENTATION=+
MYNGLLRGFPFCPQLPDKFYGDDQNLKVRYLVMERMDRDLVSVANSGTVPSSSYIAQLGLQILEGLKWIHQKNFLFIDVKPANFMLKGDKLFFVDFGLVERLQVMPAGKTAPNHQFAGTPTFCSVAVDKGEQPGAYDDLEALGWVLVSLTSGGTLPWSVSKSDEECKRLKEQCDIVKLCAERGMPEVGELILTCRQAVRTVRPNYDALQQLLTAMQLRKPSAVKAAPKVAASKAKSASAAPVPIPAPAPAVEDEAPVTKKRAVSAKKATAVEIPDFDTLAVSSGNHSPVGKKSRTARSAAAPVATAAPVVIDLDSPVAPAAPTGRSKRGTAAAVATEASSTAAPFARPAVTAVDVEHAEEEVIASPTGRGARTRLARLSTSSLEADIAAGPFSAAYKTKGAARGRSVSPGVRTPTAAATTKAAKGTPVLEENPLCTYVLRVTKGPCRGTEIVLNNSHTRTATKPRGKVVEQTFGVGRSAECEYPLSKDVFLSETHFNLVVSKDQMYIVDARSTNGTKLNGGNVSSESRTELKDGDIIKAGKTEIAFHVTN